MKHLVLLSALAAAAIVPAAASAQERSDKPDLRVRVGVGPQVRPAYVGAKDYEISPLFDVDLAKEGEAFRPESPDDSFGVRLINVGRLSFGPAAGIDGRRRDRDVGAPVGEVERTLKLGGFAELFPSDTLRLRVETLKGVNGHEGLTTTIAADGIWQDGDRFQLMAGPRLLFSDARYQRAYFGVTPAAALASRLPAYRPDGGLHAVALAVGATAGLSDRWSLFGYARGERLVGDAASSPLIRAYGSKNQFSAGLGLGYEFRVRR